MGFEVSEGAIMICLDKQTPLELSDKFDKREALAFCGFLLNNKGMKVPVNMCLMGHDS